MKGKKILALLLALMLTVGAGARRSGPGRGAFARGAKTGGRRPGGSFAGRWAGMEKELPGGSSFSTL